MQNKILKLRTPLRYPGGKAKALTQILPHIKQHEEFREPFVGGGSVFIALEQLYAGKKFWINDINFDLYCFWLILQKEPKRFVSKINEIKKEYLDGRLLYKIMLSEDYLGNEFDRAIRFFVLNRITFSGTTDSGGYSDQSFHNRFTQSSIDRLTYYSDLLKNIKITNEDYEHSLFTEGDNVMIFLDPPYFSATKSKLYGKNGDLHKGFDHQRFSDSMRKCKHDWLITYDDSEYIRDLYKFADIYEWQLQYGMTNYKKTFNRKGNELFITNYKLFNESLFLFDK